MQKLEVLRKKIDSIDASIIKKLSERQKLVQKVGQLKAMHNLPIKDAAREESLLQHYEQLCASYGLAPTFITRLFKIIFAHSRKSQRR